ncbi:restriction endonuclease subunit S [Xanthomonas campestris pv. campestris]|uniref:restriction endonuclease subunit S n=1 Tax=Xanthomonas campestris TaxID=339 RepID=UPI0032E3F12F
MKNSSAELPHGWNKATLGDLITLIVGGGTPSRNVAAYFDGNTPWFTVKDLKSLYPTDAEEHISDDAILLSATSLIEANTLIIATRIALGKAIIPTVRCAINQDLKALYLGRDVPPKFILYWFMANDQMIKSHGSGTTVKGIRLEHVKEFPLKVPPAREQCRIVDRIEELLSYLDAGIAELKSAQRKLAKYRQSLLKAAVEGTLTADWRAAYAQNCETQETGAELLQRILTERRTRWEAKELAKFAEQGKTPPRDWKAKYPEPAAHVGTKPSNLPDGWTWATVDQLSVAQNYGSSAKTNEDGTGIPVLRMGNIQEGELDLGKLKFLPQNHGEFPELFLEDGDILFNRTNSPELVGKTAVFRSQITPCSYASYLIKVRLSNHCSPELVSAYINSVFGRHWVKTVVTQQVGQANVNGSKLAALAVPLPPTDEQVEIARILVEQKKASFRHEAMVNRSLRQSTAQRKNILKAAFAGQLVPQDPNDEPASMLLERIRAERVAADAKRTGKTARKTKERT